MHSKIFPKAEERHCTQYVSEAHSRLCPPPLLSHPFFREFATIQRASVVARRETRWRRRGIAQRHGLKFSRTTRVGRPPKSAIWRTYLGGGYAERGLVRKRTRGKMQRDKGKEREGLLCSLKKVANHLLSER